MLLRSLRPTLLAAAVQGAKASRFGAFRSRSLFTRASPNMRTGIKQPSLRSVFSMPSVGKVLSREFVPSPFMIRAKGFSESVSAAAQNTGGGFFSFWKKHPFATNIIIATIKTSLCDVLVQKYVEGKAEVDWKRVSVFTAFGCLYLGFFQWAIYVTLFGRLFPGMAKFANMPLKDKLKDRRGMLNLVGQTAFDNFIHYTFIYFPVFYVFKEAIQGTGYEKTLGTVVGKSMDKYQNNFLEDNMKIWGLWIPGDMIIYAVPMWLRLPLNHALSFIWTCYLSFLRGEKVTDPKEPTAVAVAVEASETALEAAVATIEVQEQR